MNTDKPEAAIAIATTLFNDGIFLIQSFLNTTDWIAASRSSRRWFTLAQQSKYEIVVTRGDQTRQKKISTTKKITRFFSRVFTKKKALTPSHWSLASHVAEMEISRIRWVQMSGVIAPYNGLRTLTCNIAPRVSDDGEVTGAPPAAPPTFPHTLTSLTLSERCFESELPISTLIVHLPSALAQCPALTYLSCDLARVKGESMDWSPMENALSQLKTLKIYFNLAKDAHPSFSHFLHHTRSAFSLTELSLSVKEAFRNALPTYPNLMNFTIQGNKMTPQLLCALSKQMPLLQSLSAKCDLVGALVLAKSTSMSFPLFPHVRTYAYFVLDESVVSDDIIIAETSALCLLFSSEHLTKWEQSFNCAPLSTWIALYAAYPKLTQLHLSSLSSVQLRVMIDNLCKSKMNERIETLSFRYCEFRTMVNFWAYLKSFTHLQHLTIDNARIIMDTHSQVKLLESICHLFSLRCAQEAKPQFLPSLVSVKWTDEEFNLEWDSEKRINSVKSKVIMIGRKQNIPLQLHFEIKRPFHKVQTEAPAPRLVGIELNPGPPQTATMKSTQNQQEQIFTDGILLVYSYLDGRDWIHAAQICHQWFSAAWKMNRTIRYEFGDLTQQSTKPKKGIFGKLFGIFTKKSPMMKPPQVQWSLAHHVNELQIGSIRCEQLRQKTSPFLHLHTLTISNLHNSPPNISPPPALPPSLTSLSLHLVDLEDVYSRFHWLDSLLTSIVSGSKDSLISLTISTHRSLTITHATWDVLSAFTHLKSFSIDITHHVKAQMFESQSVTGFLQAKNIASSLQSLSLALPQTWEFSLIGFYLTHLKKLTVKNHDLTSSELRKYSKDMPELESLNCTWGIWGAVPFQPPPLFPLLREHTSSNFWNQGEAHALSRAFSPQHFTTLIVAEHNKPTSTFDTLAEAYPLLTDITFRLIKTPLSPLEPLACSILASRIVQLQLEQCQSNKSIKAFLAAALPALSALQHLMLNECWTASDINLLLEQATHINEILPPQLISLRWTEKAPAFDLEWDSEKEINRMRYTMSGQEQNIPIRFITTQLDRPFKTMLEPPAPRLVGIELNPGPTSKSTSLTSPTSPSTASAQRLFTDGILIVLSYLDGLDWISSALCSRTWFLAAWNSKRSVLLELGQITREEKTSNKFSKLMTNIFSRKRERILQPKWSLVHRIDGLTIRRISCNHLMEVTAPFPSLTTLTLAHLSDSCLLTSLPSALQVSLISLTVTLSDAGKPPSSLPAFASIQSFIDMLASCRSLTSLVLVMSEVRAQLADWKALRTLINLKKLHIDLKGCEISLSCQSFHDFIQGSSLRSLTDLSIHFPACFHLPIDTLNPFTCPSLLRLNFEGIGISATALRTISHRSRLLQSLYGMCRLDTAVAMHEADDRKRIASLKEAGVSEEDALLPEFLFPNLQEYTCDSSFGSRDDDIALANAFSPSKFTTFTARQLNKSVATFDALAEAYPLLTNLRLERIAKPFTPVCNSLLATRVMRLYLSKCEYIVLNRLAESLRPFLVLRHLHIENCSPQCFTIDSEATLSTVSRLLVNQLLSIRWIEYDTLDLEWNSEKRVNYMKYAVVETNAKGAVVNKRYLVMELNRPFQKLEATPSSATEIESHQRQEGPSDASAALLIDPLDGVNHYE